MHFFRKGTEAVNEAPRVPYDAQLQSLETIRAYQVEVLRHTGLLQRAYISLGRFSAEGARNTFQEPIIYARRFYPPSMPNGYDEWGIRFTAVHVNDYGHVGKNYVYQPVVSRGDGSSPELATDQPHLLPNDVEIVMGLVEAITFDKEFGYIPDLNNNLTSIDTSTS